MNPTTQQPPRRGLVGAWKAFETKHPALSQFLVFFLLSNGVTVLQMVMLPALKWVFQFTALEGINFRVLNVGNNFDGSPYFVFDYAAGSLSSGGGGGLAYFLAVQITLAIAQIINFFAQRTITFKSNSNIWRAAFWYLVAYLVISLGAAALQGVYKAPVYNLLMVTWQMGALGETLADFITMFINSAISFWVFFPIFKVIFKRESPAESAQE